MASMELVSMLMSCPGVSFKELKLIVVAECVIFPWSLIGATMQDGGKRERRNGSSEKCIVADLNNSHVIKTDNQMSSPHHSVYALSLMP